MEEEDFDGLIASVRCEVSIQSRVNVGRSELEHTTCAVFDMVCYHTVTR